MSRFRSLLQRNRARVAQFLHDNPVRVVSFVTATVTLVAAFLFPDMDPQPFVLIVTTVLGLGEVAQRKEDAKTADALATFPPDATEEF